MEKGEFIESWAYNGRTGAVERELDEIRSQYPAGSGSDPVASGFAYLAAAGPQSLLNVPSTKAFHLRTVWIANRDSPAGEVWLLDGTMTTVPPITVQPSATEFITGLEGIIFLSQVRVSITTSATGIRVGGILRDTDEAEE